MSTAAGATHGISVTTRASYPHDPQAFTQGLLVAEGTVYESTGHYGESELRRVDLTTGKVLDRRKLAANRFGEGLAMARGRLYQLTWKAGEAYVYDPQTFERLGTRHYDGEGWGLTWDGQHLIMSDGSATLRFLDPDSFQVERRLRVTVDGTPLRQINELEYIDGHIWANIWYSDKIVRIDPADGTVDDILLAHDLRAQLPAGNDAGVLNGIAWDDAHCRLFVTGKNWPRLFRITPATLATEQIDRAHCQQHVTHN